MSKRPRRLARLVAAVMALGLMVGACTPDLPTVRPEPAPEEPPVALEPAQTERILHDLAAQLTQAKDSGPGENPGRISGSALTMRRAEYAMLAADEQAVPDQLSTSFSGTFVAATDVWPRSLIAITEQVDAGAVHLYLLTQDDPRSPYRFVSWVRMVAGAEMPPMAAADKGASPMPLERADTLALAPIEALDAYAAIKEDPSAPTAVVIEGTDPARQMWGELTTLWSESLAQIKGTVKHTSQAVTTEGAAIGTADGGAIVFGRIDSSLDLSFSRTKAGEYFTLTDRLVALGAKEATVTGRAVIDFIETVALVVPAAGS
jgi:hypothetical protein